MKTRFGIDGLHLFDRNTGLNILLDDEVNLSEEKYSTTPRQVSIALTNACDLECSHCYAPKKGANLNYEQLTSWLLELDENGTLGIGFGGGEPTLYPHFIDICSFSFKHTDLAVTFTTHGHWLTDELLDNLKNTVNFIRVSIDGVEDTYESIRQRSFDVLLEKVNLLNRYIPFGINYLVNEVTFSDLDKMAILAEELGATELLLLPESGDGGYCKLDSKLLNSLKKWIINYQGKLRLAISEGNAHGLPICDALPNEKGLSAYAHIDAHGYIKESSYTTSGVKIRGNLMESLDSLKLRKLQEYNT